MSVVPKNIKHDGVTTTGYFAGCRCDPCKAAGAAYFKRRKEAAKALKAPPPPVSIEMLARRMRPQHPHTHRWRFAEPNGPTVRGQCFCGRVKFRPSSSYTKTGSIHIDLSPSRPKVAVPRG